MHNVGFAERIEKKLKERGIDARILMVVDPAELGSNNWSTHMSNLINLGLWIDVAKQFEIETTILSEIVGGNETKLLVARNCPEHIFNAMKIVRA